MTKESVQSLGGKARAEALTPEQRIEIARNAASRRWNIPRAIREGVIPLVNKQIPCAVLEDGTRVLTQQGFLRAIGRARSAKGGQGSTIEKMVPFIAAQNLKPFIDKQLTESTTPIIFKPLKGSKAFGYKAELLPQVCKVYLDARDHKALLPSQAKIAVVCDIIVRGLATVGITALIDEATGYQEIRDRQALRAILDKFVTDEWAKWTKTFPDEFYHELFKLKGISLPPASGSKRPLAVGHWTNEIVYSRLAPGVLTELRRINPR